MPYYCTVPRCTSMAGKSKDVSFHQFPKDKRLAEIWNKILKRGKPYTKYSKVCSLHFTLADYTAASVAKNKVSGHCRTLRKDAVPSQNLPSESPAPSHRGRSSSSNPSSSASTSAAPAVLEIEVGQHIAHAIYVQTMLALQNAGDGIRATSPSVDDDRTQSDTQESTLSDSEMPVPHRFHDYEGPVDSQSKIFEELLPKRRKRIREFESIPDADGESIPSPVDDNRSNSNSYRCEECSKCFKDPDVYLLHKRTHKTKADAIERLQENENEKEKENFNVNKEKSEETLKANPILANLLKANANNVQGGAMKNAQRNTNGDRQTNGSESGNSECDEDFKNVIVKSEITVEEHDVMDQISAAKAVKQLENDKNADKPVEDVKNEFVDPLEQLFIVKPEPLDDDEAARLNSEYAKVIPKSDIKEEPDSIKVEHDLITLEDLISS